MSQWGFYFNQERCIGCRACEMACKNWNDTRRGDADMNPSGYTYTGVAVDAKEPGTTFIDTTTGKTNYAEFNKYYMKENWRRVSKTHYGYVRKNAKNVFETNYDVLNISIGCNHCANPACMAACPMGAYSKDPAYGAVLVDRNACISCGKCHDACPWNAPQYYDDPAKYKVGAANRPRATKCTLCLDRIKENLRPACVAACINRAMDAGPMDELRTAYPDAVAKIPEFAADDDGMGGHTEPNIIFKPRARKTSGI